MNWPVWAAAGGIARPARAGARVAGRCGSVAALAAVIGLLMLSACDKPRAAAGPISKGPAAVPVIVATAVQRDMPVQIKAIARAEPYRTLTVRPQVAGQITDVHFEDGDYIHAKDLLYSLDTRPYEAALRQAQGVLAKDQALVQDAGIEAQRQTDLHDQGSASQREYETALANLAALEGTVRADQAAVDTAALQLEYCEIRAPIEGRAGCRLAVVGSVVKPDETDLVVLNQITPIYVTFSVAEEYLEQIRQQQMAQKTLPIEAEIPGFAGSPPQGELTFIDNQVDVTTAMITLKGTFPNRRQQLWPGQSLNAILTLKTVPQAVVVPSQAVQIGQTGPFVYVVKGNDTVEVRPVEAGAALDGETVIESGVAAGERLVTDGHLRLRPGAKIEIKPRAKSETSKEMGTASTPSSSTSAATAPASAAPSDSSRPASAPNYREGRR